MAEMAVSAGCAVCGRPLLRNRITCSALCQAKRNSEMQHAKAKARLFDEAASLPALYASGLSYRKIGLELRLSEHQVERLSRRLGLPLRGSPVQRKRKNASVTSMPTDVSGAQPELCADLDVSSSLNRAPEPPAPMGARLFPELVPPAVPFVPFRTCQWIEDDNPKTWTMCGAPTWAHKPYCRAHYRRAYTRRTDIIQEAA